jgi:hypothetical protein
MHYVLFNPGIAGGDDVALALTRGLNILFTLSVRHGIGFT